MLTRPEGQANAFAQALRTELPDEVEIILSPVLEIRGLEWQAPARGDFAILTSAHAVPALSRLRLPPAASVYCVGPATAKAVREAGFTPIPGKDDAADLIALIAAEQPAGMGVYLRGRHISTDMAADLLARGVAVAEAVVYDQRERPLSAAAVAALTGDDDTILPLFSARSARLVAGQIRVPGPSVSVVAMSETVAAAWGGDPHTVTLAPARTAEAMLDSVLDLCGPRGAC